MESKVSSRIQEIKDLFSQDRLNQAMAALSNLEMQRASGELNAEDCEKENLDEFLQGELVTTLRQDIQMSSKYYKAFEDLSGWNLIKEKGSMKTWCKYEKGMSSVYIASQCIIQCPFFNPLAIFAQIDLYKTWMPAVMESTTLAKLSTFRRLLHVKLKFPLIFSNRDYVASGVGNVDEKHKAVLFTLKGLQSGEYFGYKIPPPGKFVRMGLHLACLGLEYIDDNTCRFRSLINVNPKLPIVPMALINWGTKQVIFEFLKILTKKSEGLEGEYQERIKKNQGGLYYEVQDRLSQLLEKHIPIPFLEEPSS